MTCKFLEYEKNYGGDKGEYPADIRMYADKVVCNATAEECPKKKIVLRITPHCWRY